MLGASKIIKMINLIGQKFGRLTIVSEADASLKRYGGRTVRRRRWKCACECGIDVIVDQAKLLSGHTKSCGCYQRHRAAEAKTKHGYASRKGAHPIYHTWRGMMERCFYSKHEMYHRYGGRGIKVCDRWQTFSNFLADMESMWRVGLTIERKNRNGNYEPSNCVWATQKAQGRNTCRNNVLTLNGESLCLTEWSEKTGIHRFTIYSRIFRQGWSIEKALTTPVKA